MNPAVALAFQSFEMICDAIDFRSSFGNDLGRMLRRHRRFLGRFSCFIGRIFGAGGRGLGLCGGCFSLLCPLFISRRGTSRNYGDESDCEQDGYGFTRVRVHLRSMLRVSSKPRDSSSRRRGQQSPATALR
jgi:hypothetical protein